MATEKTTARRNDFDALRGIGALCVVAAHCAGLFSTWSPGLSGLPPSRWISEIAWLLNPWLMPLFMLLGGASIWYALGRRTVGQFVRERLIRLLAPVACATLIIVPVMVYVGQIYSGEFSGSLIQFYPHFFAAFYPTGHFSFLHFWFLVYLLLYTLLALPIFHCLRSAAGRRLTGRLAEFCAHPGARPGRLYLLALPLLAIQLALWTVAPQPDLPVLVNDWARFAVFFCLFVYGYVLVSDSRFGLAIASLWRAAGVLVCLTSMVLFAIGSGERFNPFTDLPRTYSWSYLAFHIVFILNTWSWLIFLLGAGQRFLSARQPALRYAGDASYGIYLLHPLIWPVVGVWVGTWQVAPLVRFAGLFLCVVGGTLILYELLRRCHPVCVVLGLKPAAAPTPAARPALPVPPVVRPAHHLSPVPVHRG